MWARYLGISLVKWIGIFFLTVMLTAYAAPAWLNGYWLSLPIWIIIFFAAYGFAYWALHIKLPVRRDVILLVVIWMAVTIVLEVSYEIMAVGQPVFILYSPDLYVQYLLEIIAILLAARVIRMRKLRSAAGEGMVA